MSLKSILYKKDLGLTLSTPSQVNIFIDKNIHDMSLVIVVHI